MHFSLIPVIKSAYKCYEFSFGHLFNSKHVESMEDIFPFKTPISTANSVPRAETFLLKNPLLNALHPLS